MPLAARVDDDHSCPLHTGGPILAPCEPTVIIEYKAAARVGDKAKCFGPDDTISEGSKTVTIGNKEAARLGDPTEHGGQITEGAQSVTIGD